MFLIIALFVGLAVAGLSMLIYAVCAAPEGVEGDHGFYLTKPDTVIRTPVTALPSAADLGFFRR